MITGFGAAGSIKVELSPDGKYVQINISGEQPRKYQIRIAADSNQLEIVNMEDSSYLAEEIEQIIGGNVYARGDSDYNSYELMGMYEAAEDVVKYIRENFVRKN